MSIANDVHGTKLNAAWAIIFGKLNDLDNLNNNHTKLIKANKNENGAATDGKIASVGLMNHHESIRDPD